ncbi:MAG: SBBP repeat-containing protein [bacterium]|nr:SBBP repeat-containing protein [bacterium]
MGFRNFLTKRYLSTFPFLALVLCCVFWPKVFISLETQPEVSSSSPPQVADVSPVLKERLSNLSPALVEIDMGSRYATSVYSGHVEINSRGLDYLVEAPWSGHKSKQGDSFTEMYKSRLESKTSVKRAGFSEKFVVETDSHSKLRGLEPASAEVSVYRGSKKESFRSYGEVSAGEVWQGIEVTVRAHPGNVEKLFHVRGGNPADIELALRGVDDVELAESGELKLGVAGEQLAFSTPIAYQLDESGSRQSVEVAYELRSKDSYGFRVGDYDQTRELIIDPVLHTTFLGGGLDERYGFDGFGGHIYVGHDSMTRDADGNIYLITHTRSPDMPITAGVIDSSYNDANSTLRNDIAIFKLSPDLTQLLAATYLGGTSEDNGASIAIAANGDILLAGFTRSRDFPVTESALSRIYRGGNSDAFVSRLSSDLQQLKYSTYLGGRGVDYAYSIIEESGNIYVVGDTQSNNFPVRAGGIQTVTQGGSDGFVVVLEGDLSAVNQGSYLGGSGDDYLRKVISSGGSLYLIGNSTSTNLPVTVGVYDGTHNGNLDGFIAKVATSLDAVQALSYVGGGYADILDSGIVDQNGNLVLVGGTLSTDFPVTGGSYQGTRRGNFDGLVAQMNPTLTTLLHSTYLGGDGWDTLYELSELIISSGVSDYAVIGYSDSANYPVTDNVVGPYRSGATDGVVSVLSSDFSELSASSYYGGSGSVDSLLSIMSLPSGNLLLSGVSDSSDFELATSGYDTTINGGRDAYLVEISRNLYSSNYADHLLVRTVDNNSLLATSAGATQTVKIIAANPDGETVIGIHGTKSVTLTGPAVVGASVPKCDGVDIGQPVDLVFTDGVATCTLQLYKAETVLLDASYAALSSSGNSAYALSLSVVPEASVAGNISTSLTPAKAGDNLTISVTAYDAYGNGHGSSASPATVAVTITGVNNNNLTASYVSEGLYRVVYLPTIIGTDVITATIDGLIVTSDSDGTPDGNFNQPVVAGNPYTMEVRFESPATVYNSSTSMIANTTKTIALLMRDKAGNMATQINGAYDTYFSGATVYNGLNYATCGGIKLGQATSLTYTAGKATCSLKLVNIESILIYASASSAYTRINADKLSINVTAPGHDHFRVTGGNSWKVGVVQVVTVTARDVLDDVYAGYTGNQAITFSGLSAAPNGQQALIKDYQGIDRPITGAVTLAFIDGVATAEVKAYRTGSYSLDVSGSGKSSAGNTLWDLDLGVNTASTVADATEAILSSGANPTGNCSQVAVSLTLRDIYGNGIPGSGQTVVMSVSGANTATPAVVEFGGGVFIGSYDATNSGTDLITATLDGNPVVQDTDGVSDGSYNLVINSELEQTATWNGAVSTDWGTATNWVEGVVPTACHVVSINGGARHPTINLAGGSVTVKDLNVGTSAASTLTFSNSSETKKLIVGRDVVVGATGTLTHTANTSTQAHRLFLDVGRDMTITAGGKVDVSEKGYQAAMGVPGNGPGGSGLFVNNSSTADNGWKKSPGASYGGVGGLPRQAFEPISPPTYGSMIAPIDLGSASGYAPTTGTPGNNGGGAAVITVANQLTVSGSIKANGRNTVENWSGSGSGGSVFLTASLIAGNGTISADGGNIWCGAGFGIVGGGGGGGRIALHYSNLAYTGNITAFGGAEAVGGCYQHHGLYGGAGTIFFRDKINHQDSLLLDNGGRYGSNYSSTSYSQSFTEAELKIYMYPKTAITEDMSFSSITVQNGAGILVQGNLNVGGSTSTFDTSASLIEGTISISDVNSTNNLVIVTNSPAASFTFGANSTIDNATLWHYAGSIDFGTISTTVGTNLYFYSNSVSGLLTTLTGGSLYIGSGYDLTLGSLTTISGTSLQNYGRLNLPSLSVMQPTSVYNSGVYNHSSSMLAIPAGTFWTQVGDLDVIGDTQPITDLDISGTLMFSYTQDLANSASFNSITVRNGGVLKHNYDSWSGGWNLNLDVGSFVVEAGGAVGLVGQGYNSWDWDDGNGPGGSEVLDYDNAAGGGGHGGRGGDGKELVVGGEKNVGGRTYDSISQPVEDGSSGGSANDGNPGDGGGSIRVKSPLVRIDGVIDVSGRAANVHADSEYAAGGAGGSVFIDAGTFEGTGQILANGGDAGNDSGNIWSGGGGAGRIAVLYDVNNFAGSYSAYGGVGYQNGGAGTIFIKDNANTYGDLVIDANGITGNISETTESLTINNLSLLNGAELYIKPGYTLTILGTTITGNGGARLVIERGGTLIADNVTSLDTIEIVNYSVLSLPSWTSSNNIIFSNYGSYNHSSATLSVPAGVRWVENGDQAGIGSTQTISDIEVAGEFVLDSSAKTSQYYSFPIPQNDDADIGNRMMFSNDDEGYYDLSLPFSFDYYETPYSRIAISTNGRIIPLSAAEPLTSGSDYNNNLYAGINPYQADLVSAATCVSNSNCGIYEKTYADHVVITWKSLLYVDRNSTNPADIITFQAKIFSDGSIEFHYPDVWTHNGNNSCGGVANVSVASLTDPVNLTLLVSRQTRDEVMYCSGKAIKTLYYTDVPYVPSYDVVHILPGGKLSYQLPPEEFGTQQTLQVGSLTVDAGGVIDATGLGYQAATSGDFAGGGDGGGKYIVGADHGSGGSYGGNGGYLTGVDASHAYGEYGNAVMAGSAGGHGGAGGGALRFEVSGTATINGEIRVDGIAGPANYGGGSGGAVQIVAGTLTGSGAIYARGGDSSGRGGGGGGGRIELRATTNAFSGLVGAYGGSVIAGVVSQQGGAGTVYTSFANAAGSVLRVDNGGLTGLGTPHSRLVSGDVIDQLYIRDGGKFELEYFDREFPFIIPEVTVASGGVLTHTANGTLQQHIMHLQTNLLEVQAGGAIDVSGRGSIAGEGAGQGFQYGGGGYGGVGGAGATGIPGAAFGSQVAPLDIGSGGGYAGSGGGVVLIQVEDTLILDGDIIADGVAGNYSGSDIGGAGGSVLLTVNHFDGGGYIDAQGGTGTGSGGGGSGGRIALFYNDGTFGALGSVSQLGLQVAPSGGSNGSIGTLYQAHPDHYVISVNNTQAAGATQTMTVQLIDNFGNPYFIQGERDFILSGAGLGPNGEKPTCTSKDDVAVPFGEPMRARLVDGMMTCELTLYQAQSTSINLTDGTYSTFGNPLYGGDISIPAELNADAGRTSISVSPTNPVLTNQIIVTVTAKDSVGNLIPGGGSTVAITVAGANPGTLAVTDHGNGTYTGTYQATHVGLDFIRATIDGFTVMHDTEGISDGVFYLTVQNGPISRLQVYGAATQSAGTTQTIIIRAVDSAGVTYVGYEGEKALSLSGAAAAITGQLPTCRDMNGIDVPLGQNMVLDFIGGEAQCQLRLYRTGNVSIDVTDGIFTSFSDSAWDLDINVRGGTGGALSVIGSLQNPVTVSYPATVTVQVYDLWGNLKTTGGDVVSISVSGANTASPAVMDGGNGTYSAIYTPGVLGVDEYRGTVNGYTIGKDSDGLSDGVYHEQVDAMNITHLSVRGSANQTAGASQVMQVFAMSSGEVPNPGYVGEHSITFSGAVAAADGTKPACRDKNGILRDIGTSILLDFVAGSASCELYLYKSGSTSIDATDGTYSSAGNVSWDLDVAVSAAAASGVATELSATPNPVVQGSVVSVAVTAKDRYGNTRTSGGDVVQLSVAGANARSLAISSQVNSSYRASYTPLVGGVDLISGSIGGEAISKDSEGTSDGVFHLTVSKFPMHHLEVRGSSSQAKGSSQVITVSAKSAAGGNNLVYTGTRTVTFSASPAYGSDEQLPACRNKSGTLVEFGKPTLLEFSAGAASCELYIYKAGSVSVDVSDGSYSSNGSSSYDLDISVSGEVLNKQYALWNGFLGMINVLEVMNLKPEPMTVTLTVYTIEGTAKAVTTSYTVAAHSQRDIIINDLPGFSIDTYGMVAVTGSHQHFDGRVAVYFPETSEVTGASGYGFAYTDPLKLANKGRSAVMFNSYHPGGNIVDANNMVYNWLTIANLDSSRARGFTVKRYNISGELVATERVVVPSMARRDIDGGHVSPGANNVGTNIIIPDNNNAAYLANLVRYAEGSNFNSFDYAFTLPATTGATETLYAPISLNSRGENYVEVANMLDEEVNVTLRFVDSEGFVIAENTVAFPQYSQRHFPMNGILSEAGNGYVSLTTDKPGALLAQSLFYHRDYSNRSIETGYALSAKIKASREAYTTYNFYLNMDNQLRITNLEEHEVIVTYTNLADTSGIPSRGIEVVMPPLGTAIMPLYTDERGHHPKDTYGLLALDATGDDGFVADLIRYRREANNHFEFAIPTPAR